MIGVTGSCVPSSLRWIAFGLVLTALVSATTVRAQPSPPPVPESTMQPEPQWFGVMTAGGRELRFVLESTPGETEGAAYQLRSLDEGDRRFPLDGFQVSERLEFELKLTGAKYSGQLTKDGRTATGKWSQRGAEHDLTFHKVDAVPADTAVEVWGGTLNAILQKLELRFRVYSDDDGKKTVLMDSVTQKAGGFQGTLSIDEDTWVIEVSALKGTFTGTLSADGNELDGSWEQLGMPFQLKLTRLDPGNLPQAQAPRRPQTPRPPFPYQVQEVTFENTADGVTLAGTLTIPEGGERYPAAILISGSGPQDRDETILDHKPFAVLADHLTRHGMAVLRYDDRGVGGSTGRFDAATSEDFARDAEAAFDFLRRQPSIDPAGVGLIGHSEGGLIAPLVAARRPEVAWIALLAGTGVNGREILLSQGERVLRAEGIVKEEDLQLQRAAQEGLLDAVIGADAEADEQQLVQRATELVRKKVSDEQFRDKKLEVGIQQGIRQLTTPWFRFFLTFEPATALADVRCPVLALNGEKDTQVDPELNLPAIEKALKEGHNPPFRGIVLPNLNHLFQTSESGAVSEYQEIEETMAPRMLELLTAWIHEQVVAPGR